MHFLPSTLLLTILPSLTNATPLLQPRQSSSSTDSPSYTDPTFIASSLARHNFYRNARNASSLVWSSTLAEYAFVQAQKCQLQHSGGPYGENIYWTYSSAPQNFTQQTPAAIDAWSAEESSYDGPDYPYRALHFTQVVWKASTKVGCAWTKSQCTNAQRGYYYFCEYEAQGNVLGRFKENVSTLKDMAAASSSAAAAAASASATSSRLASSSSPSAAPSSTIRSSSTTSSTTSTRRTTASPSPSPSPSSSAGAPFAPAPFVPAPAPSASTTTTRVAGSNRLVDLSGVGIGL